MRAAHVAPDSPSTVAASGGAAAARAPPPPPRVSGKAADERYTAAPVSSMALCTIEAGSVTPGAAAGESVAARSLSVSERTTTPAAMSPWLLSSRTCTLVTWFGLDSHLVEGASASSARLEQLWGRLESGQSNAGELCARPTPAPNHRTWMRRRRSSAVVSCSSMPAPKAFAPFLASTSSHTSSRCFMAASVRVRSPSSSHCSVESCGASRSQRPSMLMTIGSVRSLRQGTRTRTTPTEPPSTRTGSCSASSADVLRLRLRRTISPSHTEARSEAESMPSR